MSLTPRKKCLCSVLKRTRFERDRPWAPTEL